MTVHILQVHKDFEPITGGGGVARHIAGLAETIAGEGAVVRVVAKVATEGSSRYEVFRINWLSLARHLAWADVVHVHGARNPLVAFAAILALAARRRLIYTPHCYYDDDIALFKRLAKRLWDCTIERLLLRHSHAVVLLSKYWIHYLEGRGIPAAHPVVIPNCVIGHSLEVRKYAAGDRLAGQPAMLSVSRLDPVKRIDDAIRALTKPILSKAVLHVVGRGTDELRLRAIAAELGVSERVQFYGAVSDETVARMVSGADVFILPSAAEGMPTVLIEMILMGRPVAASDIPGNRSIMDEVGLDTLFSVGDIDMLATQVYRASMMAISADVSRATRDGFTWERMGSKLAGLYRRDELSET